METRTQDLYFLSGGGEMAELIRTYDWAGSSVGNPGEWPQSLRTTLGIILHSAFPMFLFWGKELTCFYNDAVCAGLGVERKHPAIGRKGPEVWPEIWEFTGPLIGKVMETGEPAWLEDQPVPFYRNGSIEEIYWTFSYSPAYDDDGRISGVFVACSETTGKVLSAKKLQKSENRFQSLIRESGVGIIVLSGNELVVEIANDAYCRLISREPQELRGRPVFDVIPEAEAAFRPIIETVIQEGRPAYLYDHPYLLSSEEGEKEGFLNLIYQPYHEDGNKQGVIVQCQDVTGQVLARRRAEQSEQRVRSLVESAPFPIGVYTGPEMKIELANQAIIDAWGKGKNVIGKRYSEVLPELNDQMIYSQLDDVYMTGLPYHARNRRIDLDVDGKLQPYYFNYSFTPLFDDRGDIYGVMNTAAEVTDLHIAKQKVEQSEKNFRNMILQAPVAMCVLLGSGHCVAIVNERMLGLWGKSEAEVLHKPLFEGVPDGREQGLEEMLDRVYTTGETQKADERPVSQLRNGLQQTVYQSFVYEPYVDADDKIAGVLVVSVDVTQQVLSRQKIEETVLERTKALASANNSLQKSNAELAQYAYIASHDLQEPLRKITTYTEMLESRLKSLLDERARFYMGKITDASMRMTKLIRDVLAYSELVKESEVYAVVDLNQVVKNTLSDYELLIEQKNAVVHCDVLPQIEAVPLQMVQLFGNIIGNALKFARPDLRPEIRIAVENLEDHERSECSLDPATEYCKIRFSDNGIGFSPEFNKRIFQIFQRLHRKSEYEGTGIGLAMCKKIALNHNGDLNACGSSEKGAVFNAILPLKQLKKQGAAA